MVKRRKDWKLPGCEPMCRSHTALMGWRQRKTFLYCEEDTLTMTSVNTATYCVVPNDEGKEKFKKSEDVAFYRRQIQGPKFSHQALLDTLVLTEGGAQFELLQAATQTRLLLSLSAHKSDFVRILIDEVLPIKARYRVPDVIVEKQRSEQLRVERQTEDSVTLSWSSGCHQVRVWRFPFRLEVLCEQEEMVTFNCEDKLWFESLQRPPSELQEEQTSSWRESFREFVDVKANAEKVSRPASPLKKKHRQL